MKTLMILTLALFGLNAFAAVEISGVSGKVNCTLKDGKVTRSQTFGKENIVGFTQIYEITTTGLEETLKVAEASARPNTNTQGDLVVTANLDGKKFNLALDDSKEALYLVQMMAKICKFN